VFLEVRSAIDEGTFLVGLKYRIEKTPVSCVVA
jgi:hypothetical protein